MKTLSDIQYLKDVRVLTRVDFNVPIQSGRVMNDYRLRMALPTINFLREKGAKIILVSHLEVKEGEKNTLQPVAKSLQGLGVPATFVRNIRTAAAEISNMKSGDCLLLENLRQFDGEKANDPKFAKELSSLADIYVNDAFSVCHREHASVVGVPKLLPSYAGFQIQREVEALSKAFHPDHPFLFILCGAKFDTKLPLVERFIRTAENIFIGGALAHDFYKDKGYELGNSLTSETDLDLTTYSSNPKISIPVDLVVEDRSVKTPDSLNKTDKIVDAGPKTVELLRGKINQAKFILWNGPLGLYEDGYQDATLEVAKMIAERATGEVVETTSNESADDIDGTATTIIGGGDTLAAIAKLGIENRFTFVSTAGGAMLDFLAKGTLPGIEALN
jgi:3-phosphoglycerate kinase